MRDTLFLELPDGGHHFLIIDREDFLEAREPVLEVAEDFLRERRAGRGEVLFDETFQLFPVVAFGDFAHRDHLLVELQVEVVAAVEYVCDAAAHACREVASGSAEDDGASAVMYSQP